MVRIVASSPDDDASRIYAMLLTAIDASQRSVYMTMAYFAPGEEMIDALCDAAGRGVDVQLVLPSKSDFSPVLHAGRSYYQRLLEAGVKIYELQDAVLHAKTAVIDGVVSTVGSSNLDWRSFTSNDEVNAVVFGEDFGDAMTRMFRQDQANSRRVTPEAWAERPLLQRTKETFARLLERLW
jgi:cardiolipin synthase